MRSSNARRPRPTTTAQQWNERHPVGTPVRFQPVRGRPETEDTTTTSEAWTLGHGVVVVCVAGRSGGVSVEHLTVLEGPCSLCETPTVHRDSEGKSWCGCMGSTAATQHGYPETWET